MNKCILVVLVVLISSCVSTRKINKAVQKTLSDSTTIDIVETEQIEFKYNGVALKDSVKVVKLKRSFIPAIFYWGIRNRMQVDVNPLIYADDFKADFYKYSNELGLIEKLKGKKIQVTLSSVPSSYIYDFSAQAFILVLFYVHTTAEVINPIVSEEPVYLHYKILNADNSIVLDSSLFVSDFQKPMRNMYKSSRGFQRKYIDEIKAEIDMGAKRSVASIVNEIDNI